VSDTTELLQGTLDLLILEAVSRRFSEAIGFALGAVPEEV
jgi:hypothetical protein